MKRKNSKTIKIISIVLIILFIIVNTLPVIAQNQITPFQKGISNKPFIPTKQVTFIGHDSASLLDDYAYLAALPTSLFLDNNDVLYAHPLLFYEDEYRQTEDRQRTFNAGQAITYFMDDWMSYANGILDQVTYINVDSTQIPNEWRSRTKTTIRADNPYHLANTIALSNWEYSSNAVIAIIEEEYETPDNPTKGIMTGTLHPKQTRKETFYVPQTNQLSPQYNEFFIPEGYKFVSARAWYPSFYLAIGNAGFESVVNMTTPSGDRDLQLFSEKDGEWMMTAVVTEWNAKSGMDHTKVSSYVNKNGPWSVGLTDVPTKAATSGLFPLENQKENDIRPTYRGDEIQHALTAWIVSAGIEALSP
ncbi:MAG: hypothetical protein R6V50_01210, partial [Thermoplasmatota archaeon]